MVAGKVPMTANPIYEVRRHPFGGWQLRREGEEEPVAVSMTLSAMLERVDTITRQGGRIHLRVYGRDELILEDPSYPSDLMPRAS